MAGGAVMAMRWAAVRLWLVAVMAMLLLAMAPSAAAGGRQGGRLALSLPGGGAGPLELTPGQGGWVGTFTVTNVGSEPLVVSRLAILGDEDDVRSPPHIAVRFVDGAATSATLPPGASKDAVVSWMPDRNPRVRQAFGHVVVTSTDEASGEVAMGFRARLPTGLGWVGAHVLSLLVLLPLLVPLFLGISRLFGRRHEAVARRALLAAFVLDLIGALWMYARFAPDMGRADGNDGFQFVDRLVWVRAIGAEWYLGVDGLSVSLVPIIAVTAVVAVSVEGGGRRSDAYYAALALLVSGVLGSLLALDLVLLVASWGAMMVAIMLLVGTWGHARGEHAAAKVAVYGGVGAAALIALAAALSSRSGRSFLVDGAAVAHTLSIPELARTSFAAKAPLFGLPFVEVAWSLLVVAVAVAAPLPPMHGWLMDVLEEAPGGAAIVVGGAVATVGPYLLLRLGLGVMPEGARWAGGAISALGALAFAYGSLCAMAQSDLRRFAAYASVASAGVCVFGAGALTPQGIAAAVSGAFAHAVGVALLLAFAVALERRVQTSRFTRLGGLGDETPWLGAIGAVGFAVSLGVPGTVGFWGVLLSLMGGFVRHPLLATLLSAALVAAAAAHARATRVTLFGRVPSLLRRSPRVQSLGGRIPDATTAELAALVPLVMLAVVLGIWPGPLLTPVAASVRDVAVVVDPGGADPTLTGNP